MTSQDAVGLVGALGFPIILVLGVLWFGRRDFWPWFTKYMENRAKAQDERHSSYIASIDRSTKALITLEALIAKIDTRLEDQSKRLVVIEAAARAAAANMGH